MTSLKEKRLRKWQKARFGMFIHWGLYTIDGLDCWKMVNMGIPVREYIRRFEPKFNPKKFDAYALADLAKNAGCKYVVMGSRHHEGYCLWNTRTTCFSSVHMTPKRDFIAEYVKAIRARGLMVGLYYSLLDWRYQCYFDGPWANPKKWKVLVDLVHAQVRELMTQYGKIDILWYDGAWIPPAPAGKKVTQEDIAGFWESKKLNAMVQKLQPGILVNNRSYPHSGGDFGTPEQQIHPESRPWELCDTMGHLWGAALQDLNRKTPREILTRLITCVSRSGNILLNIGPNADGSIQKWQAAIMEQIGRWLKKHGEAIYGCVGEWGAPLNNSLAPWRTTRNGNTLYMHLLHYPGPEFGIANLHNYHLKSATVLDTGKRLAIRHEPTRDIISGLPVKAPDPIATVVKIAVCPKTASEIKQRKSIGLEDPENEICYEMRNGQHAL